MLKTSRVPVDDERLKGHRCGIDNCPSRRYFKVDSRIVCDRGHEQNFLELADEEDPTLSLTVRKHKLGAAVSSDSESTTRRERNLKPLSHEANKFLYLQCYQFILQAQVKAFIELGLPVDLQPLVKDLWGLYVSALDLQIPGVTDQKIKKSPSEGEDENISALSSDADEERPSSDDDSLPALRPRKPGKPYRSNMAELEKYPPLLISTLFSYIAIVILKVPVTLNEIFGWIKEDKIPYYNAHKVVPLQMLRRLHGHTRYRLTVNTKFQAKALHTWTRSLAKFYNIHFQMTPPSINYLPILFKFITAMSFPLETFGVAKRLAEHLNLAFSVTGDPNTGGYPDAEMMALLIIACKLGFDLEKTPAWINWATATEEEERKDHMVEFEDVTEGDILMMRDDKLDEYMDWVETKWLDNELETNLRKRIPDSILSMFPLKSLDTIIPNPSPSAKEPYYIPLVPRPGPHNKSYKIYRSDTLGPPVFRRIIQRASTIIGLDESALRYSLRSLETKLHAHQRRS